MKPQISWEKHSDPWGDDLEDREWPGAVGPQLTEEEEDEFGDLIEDATPKFGKKGGDRVFVTPAGIIPLTDHNCPSKVFNLWTAHTNFDLTKSIVETIERVPGVELVYVFSRYRMLVGFGKLFKSEDVKIDIALATGVLSQSPLSRTDPVLWDQVCKLKAKLAKKPYWAIHVLPNSKVSAVNSDKEGYQVFAEQFDIFQSAYEKVGGYFLSYQDNEETEHVGT